MFLVLMVMLIFTLKEGGMSTSWCHDGQWCHDADNSKHKNIVETSPTKSFKDRVVVESRKVMNKTFLERIPLFIA